MPLEVYERFEADARERLGRGDSDDWPILAAALALECTIWTARSLTVAALYGCRYLPAPPDATGGSLRDSHGVRHP